MSAASSSLGKMIIKNFTKSGILVYGIVRNPSQMESLKNIGAKNVFLSPLND